MPYQPSRAAVTTVEELHAFVDRELEALSFAINNADALDLRERFREPKRPRDGMLVFADGTEWDPGAGRGLYVFDTIWRKFPHHFIFDVTKYGAKLDGVTDDSAALLLAAAALEAAGRGVLWFPPGGLECVVSIQSHAEADGDTVLFFSAANLNLIVEGNGTLFLLDAEERTGYGNFIQALGLGPDGNVRIKGCLFDHLQPCAITGVVSAISAGSHIDVTVDEAPTWGLVQEVRWGEANGQVQSRVVSKDIRQKTLTGGMPFTLQAGSTWRLDISAADFTDLTDIVVGTPLLVIHHVGGGGTAAIKVGRTGKVTLDDLECRGTSGSFAYVLGVHEWESSRCVSRPSKWTRLFFTHQTDGLHGIAGNISIHDCELQFMQDDCINVSSSIHDVTSRDSDTTFTASGTGVAWPPMVGTLFQFVDSDRLLQAELRVTAVADLGGDAYQFTVNGDLPASMDNTWEFILANEVVSIKNNITGGNRGKGMLFSGRRCEIAGNFIHRSTGIGVHMYSADVIHTAADEVVIRNNTIINCPHGSLSPAILVECRESDGSTVGGAGTYDRVVVADNIIEGANNGGVSVQGAGYLSMTGNRFSQIANDPNTTSLFAGGTAIMAQNCTTLEVDGNRMTDGTTNEVATQSVTTVRLGANPGILPRGASTLGQVSSLTTPRGSLINATRGVIRPETARLLDAFDVAPRSRIGRAIDDYVDTLIHEGIWDRFDVLQIYGVNAEQGALLNWKMPGAKSATPVGSPTFTAYEGYTGDGVDDYLDTNLLLSTIGQYSQNDAHMGVWALSSAASAILIGRIGGGTTLTFIQPSHLGNLRGRINDSTLVSFGANTDTAGHFMLNRTGATASEAFKNGVSLGTSAEASDALSGQIADVGILRDGSTHYVGQVFMFHAGLSLTAAQITAFYKATKTLKEAMDETNSGAVVGFLDDLSDTSNLSSYTFSAVTLGDEAWDRRIVVGLHPPSAAANTITGVTIAGVTATPILELDQGTTTPMCLYEALVPTGTSGDIVVTLSGAAARCVGEVWRLTGCPHSGTPYSTEALAAAALEIATTLLVPPDGAVIGFARSASTIAWAGLTIRHSNVAEAITSYSGASNNFVEAELARDIAVTFGDTTNNKLLLAAWAPR